MIVRKGSVYTFQPVLLDLLQPKANIAPGTKVRVIQLPNAPPPNTMGQCHVENLAGEFLGMVACNSLHK